MTLTPTIRVVGIRTIRTSIAQTHAPASLSVIEPAVFVGRYRAPARDSGSAVAVMTSAVIPRPIAFRFHRFVSLTKPRVVSLIVFTAMIGMFLATHGVVPLQPFLFGALGIALVGPAPRPHAIACWSRRSMRGWPVRAPDLW